MPKASPGSITSSSACTAKAPITILEGFTITGGNANGSWPDNTGGGMFNIGSSPTVTNCIFRGNSVKGDGGGMYNLNGSNPTVSGCTFTSNSAENEGGGMRNLRSSPTVIECIFNENTASGGWYTGGGAMYNSDSSHPRLSECTFTGNRTTTSYTYGGAIYNNKESRPSVTRCVFINNSSNYGGAVLNRQGHPDISDCTFSHNSAIEGGGIYNMHSVPKLTNCIFTGNSGGGLHNHDSQSTLVNCTFSGNNPRAIGNTNKSQPRLINCILWGDTQGEIYNEADSSTTATYSDVQGGWPGAGNIGADPLFLNAPAGDLRLGVGSPCIDAAADIPLPETDINGDPRLIDGDASGSATPDMGACEAHPMTATVPADFGTIQQAILAARPGGEIVIAPGTYKEAINFNGKAVTLRSSDGPEVTIIDATGLGASAVTCAAGEGPDTILEGFTITGGSGTKGGGIFCQGSSPTISNCRLTGNSAVTSGGGMYCGGSGPTLVNCVIYGNSGESGAAVSCINSLAIITNCTIARNSATTGGALDCGGASAPTVTNCILWANTPAEIHDQGGTPAISYCDVQGGYTGGGNNIDADPMFANAAGGDFRLHKDSPCFNAGSNSAPRIPQTDLDDGPRSAAGIVDMGAYEIDISSKLTITIIPQEAVDGGAQWRLVGESQWRSSGGSVYDIATGYYEVEFKEASGWLEPEALSIRVIGNLPNSAAGEYKRLPVFDIGQIPPREAPHGRELKFYVYSEKLGPAASLSATTDPMPQGPVNFDPEAGLFTYEPNDIYDNTPFDVTFRAESGADANSQTVEVTPIPDLPPEQATVSEPSQAFPDPCDSDYVFVTDIDLQDPDDPGQRVLFNCLQRFTRSVTIAGKTVIFEDGYFNGKYGPYDYANNVANIHDMTICAETLIIRSALHLPQTNMTIYARELRFEDTGLINTSPLANWATPAFNPTRTSNPSIAPVNGRDGHGGGDITVKIESFDGGPVGHPRFIMNGGEGQRPEPGRAGQAGQMGVNAPAMTGDWAPLETDRPPNITYIERYHWWKRGFPYYSCTWASYSGGTKLKPTAATDAVPAGKPGNGGAGGDLICTLDLSSYLLNTGGGSGEPDNGGNYHAGGVNGTPNPAYWAYPHIHENNCGGHQGGPYWDCGCDYLSGVVTGYKARPTVDGPAPIADVPVGPDGEALHRPGPLSWLSPYALKMVLAHAKDAYLYGYTTEVREILGEYEELLSTYMDHPRWNDLSLQWQLELQQMHQEIVTILHRIESGLDYFGSPPGWTPMLSFEITSAFYEQEIDRAVRVLYLSYWIQNSVKKYDAKAKALATARTELWEQAEQFRTEYEDVASLIGPLKAQAEEIARKMGSADAAECSGLLCELKQKEDQLLASAKDNLEVPWWQYSLKAMGTVATSSLKGGWGATPYGLIPGAITGCISVLSDESLANPEPWSVATARTDVARKFNSIEFDQATDEWLEGYAEIGDLSTIETDGADQYLENIRGSAGRMARGLYDVKDALKATSIDNEQVQAELEKIKAKDKTFNRLADEITELMLDKEVFGRQLAAAMQKVSTLSSGITNNVLAIDAVNRQASRAVIDPRAAMYVKDMEKRALDRLLKYHYYMARAYEYRLLKPYPNRLDIQKMFGKLKNIVDQPFDPNTYLDSQAFKDLKTAYEQQLWTLTDDIYTAYQEKQSDESTAPLRLDLSAAQIAELNKASADQPGTVTINLRQLGRFQYNEENIRIIDVNVEDVSTHVQGTYYDLDYFDLDIEHCGLSKLQKDGQIYQFTHYKDVAMDDNPINWNKRLYADGVLYSLPRSDASKSLLWSLLRNSASNDKVMLYSRPAVWADIVISKVPYPENVGNIVIDSLRLKIRYDRTFRPSRYGTLQVLPEPGDLVPYMVVGPYDNYGRQDGWGSFCRTYDTGKEVTVQAPLKFGDYDFETWTDGAGNDQTQGNHVVTVTLDSNRKRIARYEYVGPEPSPIDFNEDFYVDFMDYADLASAWLITSGDPQWDPKYDIGSTPDNVINMGDVAAFAENWLTTPQ